MQLFAPAKINLFFKILRRREDGFHEIDTLMAPISLYDELSIEPNDLGFEFFCDDSTLPADENNLVVRAVRAFFAEIKAEPRVRIELRKRIPHGAGLGGGSSDAASTLMGLNALQHNRLSFDRLTGLAASLGSDVPFFLCRSAARCRGRGEIVGPTLAVPQLSLLLLKPAFGVSTAWAYQQWRDSRTWPGIGYGPQQFGDITFENDLERPVFEKYLFLASSKEWLRAQPEIVVALLSGSGSTIFAVLRNGAAAGTLADRARSELDPALWVVQSEILSRQEGVAAPRS